MFPRTTKEKNLCFTFAPSTLDFQAKLLVHLLYRQLHKIHATITYV